MRIAYMLTSLGIGGAERQVVSVAERMASRGHEVALVVLCAQQKREWPTALEVFRIGMTKSPVGALRGLPPARSFLHKFNPDLVHSHTFPASMAARVLHLMGAAPRVVSTIHNIYEGSWERMLAYRLTDPMSSHTTAVSHAVADRYVQMGAVPRRKCSVITNGIDVEAFNPVRFGGCVDRPTHGAREFVWLAAGRAVPAKDFGNLLAAFQLIRREAPETQLWIAGNRGACEMQVDGLYERCEPGGVRWLGLCDDMPATIAAADAFVLSSAWEGMPLVVGEAMAMEKPVVATDVGGVRELVGDAGVIVPARDSAALAESMLRIMRMPTDMRRAMGLAARARIVRHFDIEAKVDQWETFYLELLVTPGEGSDPLRVVGL